VIADYHVHTTHCDGKSRAEDTVLSAISRGLSELGFSGHGYTPFDESYCMLPSDIERYIAEIGELRKKYADKIKIRLGVEQDLFGAPSPWAEYRIGSVHYMKFGDEYVDVDGSAEQLVRAANKYFGGDIYSVCEVYFEHVAQVCKETDCDIIGHFDLITKYNELAKIIDTSNPRYVDAWKKAADELIPFGVPFEINPGAISRGCRTVPYPSSEQVEYIASLGGKFILSSDCHHAENLAFQFDKWRDWALNLGAEIVESL